ncbi:MAG: glycosyltransferase family 4 protein [Chitinispirillaceae bacterium]|nr:glycosyltransferase family 4 protein [Chitinispirillaceae bacterium]
MNILIINSAQEWGGTEKWAVNTAIGLAGRGHTVFFGCRGGLFDARLSGRGVTPVKFPFANNADVVTVVRLRRFMKKHRIAAVMPTKQREYLLAGIAAKFAGGVKVAAMFAIDRPLHNARNRLAFCRLFDIVFVCARTVIDTLARTPCFDKRKCRLVYQGVEVLPLSGAVRQRQRAALGISEGEFCVMGIGRLCAQKGFDYAITAFSMLLERCPLARLVIAGGGDSTGLRLQAEKSGAAGRVVFTGFRSDIPELVQAADLYWMTSRSEGVPNTMLEAMAARVPVVAFGIAGVAEVLRNNDNGLLVPFEDIGGLSAATARLIEDPALRKRLGEAGYRTVTKDFSLEKMTADTEKHLKELLGR